eukprot:1136379-Pelagomonas_calceolata.AAC.1
MLATYHRLLITSSQGNVFSTSYYFVPLQVLAVTRLKTRSSRNPNRNNKVTLHIILIDVAGTIYNEYTIKPLVNLGLTKRKAKSLAFKLSCHAIQGLTTIITPDMLFAYWGLLGGVSLGARSWIPGEEESGRLGALLTTRPILISYVSSLS